jgi:putative peptide zinc metalloprotease protein
MWLPEHAIVHARANGFVDQLLVESGSRVIKGEPLVRSYDPALEAKLRLAQARVEELEAQYGSEFVADSAKAGIAREKLENERAAFAAATERASDLIAHAESDGVFLVPQAADIAGRFYRKGELLGYVIGQEQPYARFVVEQDAIDLVRDGTARVRVMMIDQPDVVAEGRVVRAVPAGETSLPSRALANEGGGQIAIDPRDSKNAKSLERMFQFDVALDGAVPLSTFGAHAYARFEHRMEPLWWRVYRAVRLLFLSRFGV